VQLPSSRSQHQLPRLVGSQLLPLLPAQTVRLSSSLSDTTRASSSCKEAASTLGDGYAAFADHKWHMRSM
jgi:hypothetical protein